MFLNLSRAFDSLDHYKLLKKPEGYGICGVSQSWIKSYYSGCWQYVAESDEDVVAESEDKPVCGKVSQGSIESPLFCILTRILYQQNKKPISHSMIPLCCYLSRIKEPSKEILPTPCL
ncbi:hypothetical protein HHI36_003253 [Cryptolaemus montrouzieri]|uniref:Reverse transcriptase domain-containing protein n=1 Tax=Cryptolaemus montrouzieri TaxID=559131 RepID=A0ABD2PDC7_9CUCU